LPLLLWAAVATTAACSVPPEQPIIGDFFAASRLRDTTALAKFATVVFEPRQQGIVASFDIEQVSPERTAGGMRVKDVIVNAVIRGDDGRSGKRQLIVTLHKRGNDEKPRALYGGWIVAAVRDAEPPRAVPRS
jgi:hypothetical protein